MNPPAAPLPHLVASDLDGTLLGADGLVSPATIAGVRALVTSQVPFVPVTGRPPQWVLPVTDQLGIAPLAVCANGAVLFDTATLRVLWKRCLEQPVLAEVAEVALAALPGCGLAVDRLGHPEPSTRDEVWVPRRAHHWPSADNLEVSLAELCAEPAVKLLVRQCGLSSQDVADVLAPRLPESVGLTCSTGDGLVEILPAGVSKAAGLAMVARYHGVQAQRVLAFGDMPNDVSMLRWAGCGVAMGNAHASVRAVADVVTDANTEDGVARVLRRWWEPEPVSVVGPGDGLAAMVGETAAP
ncbi:HAD family hydrolase [Rhodococcus sp. X156]|uniref:HAD family hydrolase n=1 Tax=Rhodococcus sp. X156 TaxID=2499145 RepID=UPI001F49C625|nr:HAD family hydrolase [Rhodococcus sp. X156]